MEPPCAAENRSPCARGEGLGAPGQSQEQGGCERQAWEQAAAWGRGVHSLIIETSTSIR